MPPRQAMAMDEATRSSLEILASQAGVREGSLIAAIDRCVTGAGARLLAEDLAAPLLDRDAIEHRLAIVHWLNDDPLNRAELRDSKCVLLKAIGEIRCRVNGWQLGTSYQSLSTGLSTNC